MTSDASIVDQLIPVVIGELRDLAHRRLARERAQMTLQTTDLVHEAYLRLAGDAGVAARGRAYFFAAAARAMRQVLIDAARRRTAAKRGGGVTLVTLDDAALDDAPAADDTFAAEVLELEDALAELERRNPRQARVVECRYFTGMSVDETAAALDVSPRTVKYDWALARAWLADRLAPGFAP